MAQGQAVDMRSRAAAFADQCGPRALETEQLGRLPDESVAQLLELGIARVLVPRQWSGLELNFLEVIDVLKVIARTCMSTAWCAALYAEHPWILGRSTPPLFCQPFGGSLGLVLAAVAVGGADGALDYFRERALQRVLRYQNRVQAADPAAQLDLAEATLRVTSARLLLEDACAIVRTAGERSEQLSVATLAELRARKAFVVRLCTEAIDRLFAASGGGALQETNPLQRFWRDVHAIQAHAAMNWSAHGQNYGGIAVGLEPTIHRPW